MDINLIISKFINQIPSKDNILGIIFYGSYKYHTNNSQSDIDLLLITNDDYNYKGVTYIDGIKIEFFEKNIYSLIEKLDNQEFNYNRFLTSVFKNGSIIYSKNSSMEFLKEQILEQQHNYSTNRNFKYDYYNDFNFYYNNFISISPDSNLFMYFYFNLLESIRKIYHRENGYSEIPSLKVRKLYSNLEYASKYYCVELPNQEFINLYLDLVDNGYQEEKLESLVSLIHYKDCTNENEFLYYSKKELKSISAVVKNAVDKSSYYIENKTPEEFYSYYITLEKIRKLYCNINHIKNDVEILNENYDNKFIDLFGSCISEVDKVSSLNNLFDYVSAPLQMDYKDYKILELS